MRQLTAAILLSLLTCTADAASRFQKLYGDSLDEDIVSIIRTNDGGYCLVGTTDLSDLSSSKADIAVYRTNEFGDLTTSYRIADNFPNIATGAVLMNDGTFMICGKTFGSINDPTDWEIFVINLDDGGNILWERFCKAIGREDLCQLRPDLLARPAVPARQGVDHLADDDRRDDDLEFAFHHTADDAA